MQEYLVNSTLGGLIERLIMSVSGPVIHYRITGFSGTVVLMLSDFDIG